MRNEKQDLRRASALVTTFAFALGALAAPASAGAAVPAPQGAPQTGQSPLVINHDELPCVVTDFAPKVDAQVAPAPQFDKGYVYFKAAGTEDFYYTPMKGAPDNLEGVLPRPLPETKAIDYKVRARDTETLTKETREYVPPVVPGNACKTKGLAVPKEGAGLTIGLTREGQNPVPPGFNKKDIAFVILASGAVVGIAAALKGGTGAAAGGGGGAGAGGGGSTALYVVGGVAIVGGAVAIGVNNNKSSNPAATATPTATNTPTRTPTSTPTPIITYIASATWSGLGDVDIQILDPNGQSVGAPFPAGCESTGQRTEQVLLQSPAPGTYRLMVSAKSCGIGTPSSIAAVVSVQLAGGQPKCANAFVNVPVGGSAIQACTFSVP